MRHLLYAFAIAACCLAGGLSPARAQERQEVDCAASRITVPGAQHCWWFQRTGHAYLRPGVWWEDSQKEAPSCTYLWHSVQTASGGFAGYVRFVRLQPGADMLCNLGGTESLAGFRAIAQTIREAQDLSFPRRSENQITASFISADGKACRAFIVLGAFAPSRRPPFENRESRLDGYLCAPPGRPLQDTDLETYLGSVRTQ